MIPYGHQTIDGNDIKSVIKVLRGDWLTQGPEILRFEKALAKSCGVRYAVACSSGTAALHLAYMVAGFKLGDEVITVPNTFAATSNMLMAVGARPVFCDIRLDTYNIDETKIVDLVTGKTRAIVPVHFAGQPCEMEKIKKIAQKHNLLIIEDACHALGARYKNSKIGDCRYSDMAVLSFHPVKAITTGEGGAILTNNKKYYEKLISLRNHGIHKDAQGKNVMTELGFNYRLSDIQAALGANQLKKINSFIKKRRRIIKWYKEELADLKQIILPDEIKNNYSAWHIYVIRTVDPEDRDNLVAYLKKKKIGVNFHYPAVYAHPYYRQNGYSRVNLINEEAYHQSCITLPCYPGLTGKQVKYVSDSIKKYFKINKTGRKIHGQRIYLRELDLKDVSQDYCDWLNDKSVNKFLETKRCTLSGLKSYVAEKLADPNCYFAGIFDKKNNLHIGNVKLEPINWRKKEAVFGILIGNKNYWGKGLGAEATKLMVKYAFSKMGLKKVSLGVMAGHNSAIATYKKAGFKINGIKGAGLIMSIKK